MTEEFYGVLGKFIFVSLSINSPRLRGIRMSTAVFERAVRRPLRWEWWLQFKLFLRFILILRFLIFLHIPEGVFSLGFLSDPVYTFYLSHLFHMFCPSQSSLICLYYECLVKRYQSSRPWTITLSRLSATHYSVYLQLAFSPISLDPKYAMSWSQGTYWQDCVLCNLCGSFNGSDSVKY